MDWLDKIIADAETGERAPGRAVRWPRLRPYLPDRHALRRLIAGSLVLFGYSLRGLRWAVVAVFTEEAKKPPAKTEKSDPEEKDTAGKGKGVEKKALPAKATPKADWLEQAGIGLLGSLVGVVVVVTVVATVGPRLHPYMPIATGLAVLAWVVAAWIVAPKRPPKKAEQEPRKDVPETALLDTPEGRRIVFLRGLEKMTRGTAGMHLDQMHRMLTEQEPTAAMPRHHLRPLLDYYGIPVQRTLRVGAVSGRSGVTRQAIEAALGGASAAPPLATESGVGSPMESGADLPVSAELSSAPQAVESGS